MIRVARIQIGRTNDFVDEFISINSELLVRMLCVGMYKEIGNFYLIDCRLLSVI